MTVKIPWRKENIVLTAVYAYNDADQNESFWRKILAWTEENTVDIPKIDFLLGDMNFVEDEMDRSPVRLANVDKCRASFKTLREARSVTDLWREQNGKTMEWTWMRPGSTERSRIDRIYVNDRKRGDCRDWTCELAVTGTDHYMVSVDVTDNLSPEIGEGRWAIPNAIIEDRVFQTEIETALPVLRERVRAATEHRTATNNIQKVMQEFKNTVLAAARRRAKQIGSKSKKKISDLNRRRGLVQNDLNLTEEERANECSLIEERILKLTIKMRREQASKSRAVEDEYGESMSKYFFSKGKSKKPRDVISSLKIPHCDPPRWESQSRRMAETARTFYADLQTVDTDVDPEKRDAAIDEALANVNRTLSHDQKAFMGRKLTKEQVKHALNGAKNNSAPGTDGLPYEFWKMLASKYDSQTRGRKWIDILEVLTLLFNDIEEHGVDPSTTFTEGWLCPIWKKGNKDDIANYRPITLLNTDYKLLTKALSMKLATVAPMLIDVDQAGFIPGRSIFDQCKLARLMVDWGETMEENGAIVCLDQEKAYDRIRHDYLLLILGAFNLPESFVKTVASLYANAYTKVAINGMFSSQFRVTRGVRQGDPLSCLLFNLAIEPLAESIRTSDLIGFKIPGAYKKLIISLFADDTCVFLSEKDDPDQLYLLLGEWCLASGAKFNVTKTEIVPIGTTQYRAETVRSRRMAPSTARFPDSARIADEGEAVRLLGAYIGNGIDQQAPWQRILDSVRATAKIWQDRMLSIQGKCMIVKSIMAGKVQYLATVQGIPDGVLNELETIKCDFMREKGKKTLIVNESLLMSDFSKGGRALHSFRAAAIAQQVRWIESYMQDRSLSPKWTFVADAMLAKYAVPDDNGANIIPLEARVNPFLQQWHPNNSLTPPDLMRMWKAAQDLELTLDAPSIPRPVQLALPLWFHIGRRGTEAKKSRAPQADEIANCLIKVHLVILTEHAVDALRHWSLANHKRMPKCTCDECDRCKDLGCKHPSRCRDRLQRLLNELSPKWDPRESEDDSPSLTSDERIRNNQCYKEITRLKVAKEIDLTFDPDAGKSCDIAGNMRIIGNSKRKGRKLRAKERRAASPIKRPRLKESDGNISEITIELCEDVDEHGTKKIAAAAVMTAPPKEWAIRMEGETLDQEIATIAMIETFLRETRLDSEVRIISKDIRLVRSITADLATNIASSWAQKQHGRPWFQNLIHGLGQREARTRFRLVAAEHASPQTVRASALATLALGSNQNQQFGEPLLGAEVQGHVLARIKQATTYSLLIEGRAGTSRRGTELNIGRTRAAISEITGRCPSPAEIWLSLKSGDLRKQTRDFLWKLAHNTQKVGQYWWNVEGQELKSDCPVCEVTESMDHILFECNAPGQEQCWQVARTIWEATGNEFPEVSLGLVIGCNLVNFGNPDHLAGKSTRRLFRIIISETAFTIWKLRNNRRFQTEGDGTAVTSPEQARRACQAALKARVRTDIASLKISKPRQYLKKRDLVVNTWIRSLPRPEDTVDEEHAWAGPEFLVSIRSLLPSERREREPHTPR